MRIWLWKYTFLFMSGYGHDESVPTPNGMFATNFVGVHHVITTVRHVFRVCSLHIRCLNIMYL